MDPVESGWKYYFEHSHPVSEDFMLEREQPAPQTDVPRQRSLDAGVLRARA
jgi:hypothetical protein